MKKLIQVKFFNNILNKKKRKFLKFIKNKSKTKSKIHGICAIM